MWLEMNCAVVWKDVDIRVMHSSYIVHSQNHQRLKNEKLLYVQE
jgi:hypothetical protein